MGWPEPALDPGDVAGPPLAPGVPDPAGLLDPAVEPGLEALGVPDAPGGAVVVATPLVGEVDGPLAPLPGAVDGWPPDCEGDALGGLPPGPWDWRPDPPPGFELFEGAGVCSGPEPEPEPEPEPVPVGFDVPAGFGVGPAPIVTLTTVDDVGTAVALLVGDVDEEAVDVGVAVGGADDAAGGLDSAGGVDVGGGGGVDVGGGGVDVGAGVGVGVGVGVGLVPGVETHDSAGCGFAAVTENAANAAAVPRTRIAASVPACAPRSPRDGAVLSLRKPRPLSPKFREQRQLLMAVNPAFAGALGISSRTWCRSRDSNPDALAGSGF